MIDNTKIYYNVKLLLSIMLHFFQNIINSRQCSTFSRTTSLQSMNVVHSVFMIRSFWLAVYSIGTTQCQYNLVSPTRNCLFHLRISGLHTQLPPHTHTYATAFFICGNQYFAHNFPYSQNCLFRIPKSRSFITFATY